VHPNGSLRTLCGPPYPLEDPELLHQELRLGDARRHWVHWTRGGIGPGDDTGSSARLSSNNYITGGLLSRVVYYVIIRAPHAPMDCIRTRKVPLRENGAGEESPSLVNLTTMLTVGSVLLLLAVTWATPSPYNEPISRQSTYERDLSQCPGYKAVKVKQNGTTLTADLILAGSSCNAYGTDIESLSLEVTYDTGWRHS
jgi:hypothetical protein